nr:reverse transcriptase domain-containing protein [Tanacetum cinerariifolium]
MITRSSARNLFLTLDNPELTIRRRSRTDPTLLNNFEMAAEGNGDLPSIKVNGVTDDALRLYLFPHSLTHHATAWFDRLPRNSINTFEQMAKMFLRKYFPPSMVTKLINEITNFRQHTFYNGLTLRHRDTINAAAGGTFMKRRPKECYDLIENMTAHHNDWDTSTQRTTIGQTQNVYAAGAYQDALILMPKFGPSIKSLLTNKDKLYELARTPLNVYCSAVLLKKLPEKLGDPGNFLIPCDFPGMAECLALADLGASINLMPLSVWNKLSIPELSPTCMTLELANRLISCPVGVAEDVFVKVGTFHFPADIVVVDFDADPRVPLILGRSFLKTGRALIDVFKGELTLRVGKEAITFNLDQTSRYSANYNDMTANRIEVIDMACEDDFLLEKVDAFLALYDDPTSPEVDQSYFDPKGDILLLEAFLNDDPLLPPPNQGSYLPQVRKELKNMKLKLINLQLMSLPSLNLRTYLLISNTHFWRGEVVEGSGKSWVMVGRQEKRGEWVAGLGGKSGVNSGF